MKQKEAEIEEYSKEEWLELINKSLKKGSIEDIILQIEEKAAAEPYTLIDDLKSGTTTVSKPSKSNKWRCGLDYSLVPNEEVNSYIKHHSYSGLESFVLYSDTSDIDFERIFKGIELDRYDIILNTGRSIDKILFMEKFKDHCLKKSLDHKKQKINIRLPFYQPEDMIELYRYLEINFPQIRFFSRPDRNLSYHPVQYLVDTFNSITDFIRKSELDEEILNSMFPRWKIHLFTTEKFMSGIAMMRAFKTLWSKYLNNYNIENPGDKIIMGIHHNAFCGDPGEDIAISTIATVAGAICGVHSINISTVEMKDESSMRYMSALLKIQQLLKKECQIQIINDRIEKNSTIEIVAEQIEKEVWKKLL